MRSALLVTFLVSASAFLAGCSDDGGHEHESYTCPDGTVLDLEKFPDHDNATFNPLTKCPKSSSTTTSLAPNKLPTLVLKVTNDEGEATPVTMLNGNLTFDATGSTDSDGTVSGIAVSVTDSNSTRTASLYDAATKSFKTATFGFDRPGIINVTVAMVDDRAGFTVNQSKVYVNHEQPFSGGSVPIPAGAADIGVAGTPCEPTGTQAVVEAFYYKEASFLVSPGATLIEATNTGAAVIQICSLADAEGARTGISDVGESVATAPGTALPPPTGIGSYAIRGFSTEPNGEVVGTVIVHYEPQAAA